MNNLLRKDADQIVAASIKAVLPDEAVRRALQSFAPKGGKTLLVATGKAACPHLQAWRDKVAARPAWQRALEKGGPVIMQ